jgi:hypothetical protein
MANNPISFVDPDGGKANYAGMNDAELEIHFKRLKKQEKEWWDANRNNYRRSGGDHDGSNWYYHEMNMLMYGTTVLVDSVDVTTFGSDGSFYSSGKNDFYSWVFPKGTDDDANMQYGAEMDAKNFAMQTAAANQWSDNNDREYIENGLLDYRLELTK